VMLPCDSKKLARSWKANWTSNDKGQGGTWKS
jgi:hypothetical protein